MQAGHDSTNAELIYDDYSVSSTPISDVSQFGEHIYQQCQHLQTFRLIRDSEPHGKESAFVQIKLWKQGSNCLSRITPNPIQKVAQIIVIIVIAPTFLMHRNMNIGYMLVWSN